MLNFEWFTLSWLMNNLHWFIIILVVSIILLFLFPVLLGYDLKDKAKEMKEKEHND